MQLEGKVINFLGDSITEGVGVADPANIFPARIQAQYGLRRANNYGISGTRIARKRVPSENPSFDQDFCSRAGDMDPAEDAVVVLGGTNDYGHGDAPIGTPADRTKDTFWGACHELMRLLIERYPGKPIVFCTPLHRLNEELPDPGNRSGSNANLREYIEIIRETARYYSLPVLDLHAACGIQPSVPVIRELLIPDGLHPNDAGHARLADCIANFLRYQV